MNYRNLLFTISCLLLGTGTVLYGQTHQNLLENPGALQGNLDGWEIIENGGDGWGLNIWGMNGTSCFAASYQRCSKSQLIDLLDAGYTADWLDNAPIVVFSEWYRTLSFDHDIYFLDVELLDANDNVIAAFYSGDLTTASNWQQMKGHFLNYGQGLRKIRYTHGGEDTENWAGQFGVAIDASYVSIGNHLLYGEGSTGTFAGWDIITNGGDGWGSAYGVFTTSFSWCNKSQTVDLWEYYSPALLDQQPKIDVGNYARGHSPNFMDVAETIIRLLDEDMNTLAEYTSSVVELSENWAYYGSEFTSYGTGLRYIYFEHGGSDVEYWSGNYGAQFTDAEILIDFNVPTSSKEVVATPNDFSLFPNPSTGEVTVGLETGNEKGTLFVTNLYGQVLLQRSMDGEMAVQLSLQHLPKGTYLVQLQLESGLKVKKLMLQ